MKERGRRKVSACTDEEATVKKCSSLMLPGRLTKITLAYSED